jgi:hypothetical protein
MRERKWDENWNISEFSELTTGEGVGYFNMGSYGTTLFKALGIVINFFLIRKNRNCM